MKRKEIEELKVKPLAELQKLSGDIKERLRVLKFDLAAGKVKNVSEIKNLRKDLARVFTFINSVSNKIPKKRERLGSPEAETSTDEAIGSDKIKSQ